MTTWLRIETRGAYANASQRINLDRKPLPTVNTGGVGPGNKPHHYWIESDDKPMIPKERRTKRARQLFDAPDAKPPYRVPSMAEVAALPSCGLTVASLFAGCGGSSLGYRMAGFRVLYANEFVANAAESYRANAAAGTIVDGRDVKEVTAESILEAIGLRAGELDVLDGSPPCQAYSTAGLREKGWGTERRYSNGKAQRNEDMFFEFVRIRDGLMPRAFVAENVSGLVKGAAKGYFLDILKRLKRGYRVEARVLDAQWLGVPQQRQRVIFVGVREDLGLEPTFPSPLPYRYSVRDALPWLGSVRFDNGGTGTPKNPQNEALGPIRAIVGGHSQDNHLKVADAVVSKNSNAAFPHKNRDYPTDEVAPTVMARRANLEVGIEYRGRPGAKGWRPGIAAEIRRQPLDQPSQPITAEGYGAGGRHQAHVVVTHRKEFSNERVTITDGPAPTITAGGKVDNSSHFMVETRKVANGEQVADNVAATIEGYAIGKEYDRLNPGQASDKFFNLVRADASKPSPTITSQGTGGGGTGAPGGVASVCHPTEKRKFTIAELRRLCGFPDDFALAGSYAQQWERLGNSVPPVMMFWVAATVRDLLLARPAARTRGRAARSRDRSTKG